jgi:hypothetical protein
LVRNRKGPAGATARAQCDVDSADEQIKSQHGAPHDRAQGTLWECVGNVIEWPASPTLAPRAKRKPKDAGCWDPQPSPLLDLIARTAAAGAATDDASAVPHLDNSERETPRAGVRARPSKKPAVAEPIVSHRLAREPWVWRAALLASRLKPWVKVVGFAIAEFVNKKTAFAFPTYATVAARCAMTEEGVRKAVKKLEQAGFLTKKKTRFKGPNELRLAVPSSSQSGTAAPDCEVQSGTGEPDKPAPSCRTNRHRGAGQSGTEEPVELKTEPSTEYKTEPLKRPSAFCNDAEVTFDLIASRVDALLSTKPNIENAIAKYVDGIEIPLTSGDHAKVESRQPGARSCLLEITRSFMRSFGYELGDRSKIDGQYPDLAFFSRCPENVLVEMVLRTRRRELTARDVTLVATAAGLPRRTAQ